MSVQCIQFGLWHSGRTSEHLCPHKYVLPHTIQQGESNTNTPFDPNNLGNDCSWRDTSSFSLFLSTEPSTAIPKLYNQGSNQSILVTWDHPVGGLDRYILNISSEGWSNYTILNNTEHNHTFTQLKAATVYTVTLTTVKGAFQETSLSVNMATCEYSTPNHSQDFLWQTFINNHAPYWTVLVFIDYDCVCCRSKQTWRD